MANRKPYGDQWVRALSIAKPRPLPIRRGGVPTDPGVYIWFRDGHPIYVGEALGAEGLRGRLRAHFAKNPDVSRSTLRASVAAAQLRLALRRFGCCRIRRTGQHRAEVAGVNGVWKLPDFITFKKAKEKTATRCHAPRKFLEVGGTWAGSRWISEYHARML
jgi:hypothetical protein